MEKCNVCGSKIELVTVTQLDNTKVIWDFGYYNHINETHIIAKKVYCNQCFLRDVWNPRIKKQDS